MNPTVNRILALTTLALLLSCGGSGHRGRTHEDYQVWGIDVSRHQHNIDWDVVVKRNPPHFVFLKATEGTLIADPSYQKNAAKLDELGILRGAYHFFGHRTPGRLQAENFIRTAELSRGNLLPVLDIEPHRFMTDPKKSVKEASEFCKVIRNHYGVDPIIYCSTHFYERYLQKDFPAGKYTIWLADYRGNPHRHRWKFWQHTDSHRLHGIRGNVDRNVFAGTAQELNKYTIR
ncbi:MAG: hypothetical protein LIO77_01300 [Rikenellaceae bacterium]|nr:hypothetical protein [Rikenellaceae bacterium]